LKKLKRQTELLGRTEYFPVIGVEYLPDVERIIRQHLLDEHDKEIGVLKAKVYAYEKIIANSNFAPMIVKEKPIVRNEKTESELIDCESTKCENCVNHNECEYEPYPTDKERYVMTKDSSIKDIEAGKGIPPIPTSGNGDGTKMIDEVEICKW
jgi:hypothetical protein